MEDNTKHSGVTGMTTGVTTQEFSVACSGWVHVTAYQVFLPISQSTENILHMGSNVKPVQKCLKGFFVLGFGGGGGSGGRTAFPRHVFYH